VAEKPRDVLSFMVSIGANYSIGNNNK